MRLLRNWQREEGNGNRATRLGIAVLEWGGFLHYGVAKKKSGIG